MTSPTPTAAEQAANLPAVLRITTDGVLDLDRMRAQAPLARQALIDAMRHSAAQHREARGTVVVPEDTYELVRRLTAAQEVLTQWSQAFTAAAKEAAALVEEEALTVAGAEADGALTASLFVPDGDGQRIAVRADWKPGTSTWDTDTLRAWVAEQTVADEGLGLSTAPDPVFTADEAVSLCRDALDRLLALGSFTPAAAKVEAKRKQLAERGRDAEAAVLRQVRTVGPRTYKGVTITREESK